MRYPEEVIEEVRTRNDIVDVVSGYVTLQRKGNYYFGLCPFHNEKSPSFSVSPGKQIYHCFGCGVGGNVITFIMEYENYTFGEALQFLADRAGIALPKRAYSQEERERDDLKKTLLQVNKLAANYFYHQLKQPQGKPGYDYLKGRQLSDDTIRRFGLGYSNKTSDDLYRFLKSKGYADDLLKETGLVTIEERGGRDKFWNRVMFPIMDINNRVIGFGGRVMGEGKPKYLNSPETKLFDKSRNLFGLNYARTSREKYILICEGYMDVIALHQAGFGNSVASLGTAFTGQQAVLLKRYTDQVILTYDSDEAGVKAALRAIPILKEVDMSVKVLDMTPHKDPDEFIKNLGADRFRERIEKAKNSFLFEIDVLRRQFDMEDPEQKTRFYQETAGKLLEFTESLERDNYIQAVSREHLIPYEDLKRLVNRMASHFVPGSRAAGGSGIQARTGGFGGSGIQAGTGVPGGAGSFAAGRSGADLTGRRRTDGTGRPEGRDRLGGDDPSGIGSSADGMDISAADGAYGPVSGGGYDGSGQAGSGRTGRAGGRQPLLKGREEGVRRAQRLLLTWLIEDPGLYPKVETIITAEDFVDPLYRKVAQRVFQDLSRGKASPAAILDDFIDDEGQYREVAALFHASVKDSLSNEEQRKAFSEIVRKVKENSLEQARKQATDLNRLQQIVKEQAALRSLHISL